MAGALGDPPDGALLVFRAASPAVAEAFARARSVRHERTGDRMAESGRGRWSSGSSPLSRPVRRDRCSPRSSTGRAATRSRFFTNIAADLRRRRPRSAWAGEHVFLVNDPRLVRDMLVTHQRNFTKGRGLAAREAPARRRAADERGRPARPSAPADAAGVSPRSHRRRTRTVMTDYADRMQPGWRDGATSDVAREMTRLTLGDRRQDAVRRGRRVAGARGRRGADRRDGVVLDPDAPVLRLRSSGCRFRCCGGAARRAPGSIAIIYGMIAERRRSRQDRGDLLSMLLLAQDEEAGGPRDDAIEQVRDEAMTHLPRRARDDGQRARLDVVPAEPARRRSRRSCTRRSIACCRAACRRSTTLPSLTVHRAGRHRVDAALSAGLDHRPAGARGLPARRLRRAGAVDRRHQPVSDSARRPVLSPSPSRFRPERWTPEFKASLPPFAYVPFGGGARRCIGESFAWMELVLVVSTIAQRWKLRLVPGHPVVPQPVVTLRMKHGLEMTPAAR